VADRNDCAFCRIADGIDDARIVYQDDRTMAFFPLNPAMPGHTLIIPREHVPDFLALDKVTAHAVTASTLRVARALRRALAPAGMNVITSAGAAAQQTVFHLHVHVLPREDGDRVGDIWPNDEPMASEMATKLQEQVAAGVDALNGED
jgi:histidine triad (HIT) family protein